MPVIRTTDADEAAALRARGARLVRHAHDMALDLVPALAAAWAPPAGLRLDGVAGRARDLAAAAFAAYAPGHPDAPGSLAEAGRRLERLLAGESTGPVLEPASAALTAVPSGETVAAIVVTRLDAESWWAGGAWVADVFAVQSQQGRGLGRSLLVRAIAVCGDLGEPRIGLSVTDGNPAERLYAAVGFRRRRTVFVLDTG